MTIGPNLGKIKYSYEEVKWIGLYLSGVSFNALHIRALIHTNEM